MNAPIVRIYVVILLLFALARRTSPRTGRCSTPRSSRRSSANRRPLIEEQQIPRGSITTADGVADRREPAARAAASDPSTCAATRRARCSATRSATASSTPGRTGIELLRERRADRRGERVRVDHRPAPRPAAERRRHHPDARRRGPADRDRRAASAVAATGTPSGSAPWSRSSPRPARSGRWPRCPAIDPNVDPDPTELSTSSTPSRAAPLINRATQSTYPPGSTMKVVTAAAGARLGRVHPGHGRSTATRRRRSAASTLAELRRRAASATSTMTDALTNSVNTYWAQVGEQLGTETMVEYMERFGFYSATPSSTTPTTRWRRAGSTTPTKPTSLVDDELRHRPRRDRPGRRGGPAAGDADPDGGGRGDGRQRRQADEADLPPGGQRPRRPRDRGARPRGAVAR